MSIELESIERNYANPYPGGRDFNGKLRVRLSLAVACAVLSGETVSDGLQVMALRGMRCFLAQSGCNDVTLEADHLAEACDVIIDG